MIKLVIKIGSKQNSTEAVCFIEKLILEMYKSSEFIFITEAKSGFLRKLITS